MLRLPVIRYHLVVAMHSNGDMQASTNANIPNICELNANCRLPTSDCSVHSTGTGYGIRDSR